MLSSVGVAQASPADVRVDCPDLTSEQQGELEARARAELLISDVAVLVELVCRAGRGEARLLTGPEPVVVPFTTSPATVRDDALRSLDEALRLWRARGVTVRRAELPAPRPTPAPTSPAVVRPERVVADVPPPVSPTPALPPNPPPSKPVSSEVGPAFVAETWGERLAIGGQLETAWRLHPALWLGLRAGAFRPLRPPDGFDVLEAHLLALAIAELPGGRGLRLGVAVGPSNLLVTPGSGLSARTDTTPKAVRIEARVSRPFRWGWFELVPFVGARVFTSDRGVRIGRAEKVSLSGIDPALGLSLTYRTF